jgi:Flp pilus assembly protein TadG
MKQRKGGTAMAGLLIKLREERGISAVVAAVSLVGLFGAAVLAIDAGSTWATRRKVVTGTDAAALAAARYFSEGLANPCTSDGQTLAENEATAVLHANSTDAEHIAAPTGFEVVVSGCASGTPVGHVRYDARLGAKQGFSGLFGFGQTKPYSSSTAEFGYITSPVGLRPIAICDQSSVVWPPPNVSGVGPQGQPVIPSTDPVPGPTSVAPPGLYPHFTLWNWYQKATYAGFGANQYNRYFGTLASDYPSVALDSPSKNSLKTYLAPADGGGVVHRINARDSCGGGPEWRGWVNLNGGAGGTGNGKCDDNKDPQTLECMLVNGYDGFPGPVSVGDPGDPSATPPVPSTPNECNNSPSQWCAENTGNHNGIKDSLDPITCPAGPVASGGKTSADCIRDGLYFPIILTDGVVVVSGKDEVHQKAFVYVILRGWGGNPGDNQPCNGNAGCFFDFEFVKIQATGTVGHNPSPTDVSPRGIDLCGIDHDSRANRCNV